MQPFVSKFLPRVSLLCLLLFGHASCQSYSWSFPPDRNGPPFAEAFGDPSVLLDPGNLKAMRKRLERTPLPSEEAHHERLLALVAGADSIEVENLALIADAVALPSRTSQGSDDKKKRTVWYSSDGNPGTTFLREAGPFSHYVDEILLLGAPKVNQPTAAKLGRLMATTQTRETVVALYDLLGPEVDDGSLKAFREMVDGARFDEVQIDLAIGVFVPRDQFDQERAEIVLDDLAFDDSRLELVQAWVPSVTSFSSAGLPTIVDTFSFDDGRADAVRAMAGAPLDTIRGETMCEVLDAFSFDDGRTAAMRALAPKLRIDDPNLLPQLLDEASFDDGRIEILRSAVPCVVSAEAFRASVAKDCLDEFSFDEGREDSLAVLAPLIQFTDLDEAEELLKTASFDDAKVEMIRVIAPNLCRLEGDARELEDLLEAFSFDAGRSEAVRMLAPAFRGLPASDLWDVLEESYSFADGRKEAAAALGLR